MKLFKRKSMLGKFMDLVPKIYEKYSELVPYFTSDGSPMFLHKDTSDGKIIAIIGVGDSEKFKKELQKRYEIR